MRKDLENGGLLSRLGNLSASELSCGLVEGMLIFLVIFSPLAFGSVEPWAVGIIQYGATLIFLLWSFNYLWHGRSKAEGEYADGRLLHPLRRSGTMVAVAGFVGVVICQLVPLPPQALRVASPGAFKEYRRTLPYYSSRSQVDFNRLEKWLLKGSTAKDAENPSFLAGGGKQKDLVFSSWRTISLVPSSTRRSLGLFLTLLIVFMVVADRSREPGFRRRLLLAIVITGVFVALLGLAQKTNWGDRIYGRIRPAYGGNPLGPFVNPNHFAGYLELSGFVFAGMWLGAVRRERTGSHIYRVNFARDRKYIPQVFVGFLFLLITSLAFWRSGSRGGLIAAGSSLLLFACTALWGQLRRNSLRWVVSVALFVTVMGGVGWKIHSLTVESSRQTDMLTEPSFSKRLTIWKDSLKIFQSYPIGGSGLGTYAHVIPLYQSGGHDRLWIYAHNDYLQLLTETGFLGILCFGLGFMRFLSRVLIPIVLHPFLAGGAALGCTAGIVSILIHSLMDFNLQIPSNGLLFIILAGVLVGVVPGNVGKKPHNSVSGPLQPLSRRAVICFSTVILVSCVIAWVSIGRYVTARKWQTSATEAFWKGEPERTKEELVKALEARSDLSSIYSDQGFLYLRGLDRWETLGEELSEGRQRLLHEVRTAFFKSLNLNPINTNTWSGLAEVYLHALSEEFRSRTVEIETLLQKGADGSALERVYAAVLDKMMSMEPKNPYFRARRGDYLWERGREEEALLAYEQAVRFLPKIDEHPFLSEYLVTPNVREAAIRGALKALHERTSGVPAHKIHLNLSRLYQQAGDTGRAIWHMEKAVKLHPLREWYYRRLGYLYYSAGELKKSRDVLRKSLEFGAQGDEYPYWYLARIARQNGDLKAAVAYFGKALGTNPENARVASELASLYEEMENYSKAKNYYDLSMKLQPEDINILVSVADFYIRQEQPGRAVAALEKAVAIEPDRDVYRQKLEEIRRKTGLLE